MPCLGSLALSSPKLDPVEEGTARAQQSPVRFADCILQAGKLRHGQETPPT